MNDEQLQDYWLRYAEELAGRISANGRIALFTRNPALIGAFAESSVVGLIKEMVAPYQC